jgi:hypothetical protein
MMIAGFDPGQKGGVSVIDSGSHKIWFKEMPTMKAGKKTYVDEGELACWLRRFDIDYGYIERVHFIKDQGGVSSFTFGESLGVLKGVCAGLGINRVMVEPQKWKADMHVPANKEGAVRRMERLVPSTTIAGGGEKNVFIGPRGGLKDGIAEAGLIAVYGCLLQGVTFTAPIAMGS